MATKNLGQVVGIVFSATEPDSKYVIWFDTNPSRQIHKVYDFSLNSWQPVYQNIVTAIAYQELVTLAANTGLTLGSRYIITDRSNTIAVAITSTKVVYVDPVGNILVDDLGTNIVYHVSQSNFTFDGLSAVYDEEDYTLNFNFTEVNGAVNINPTNFKLYAVDDTINDNTAFRKFSIRSLLSTSGSNSIVWSNGFFFDFVSSLNANVDVSGGLVSWNTYQQQFSALQAQLNEIGGSVGEIITNVTNLVTQETADAKIYGKKIDTLSLSTAVPAVGDTLRVLIGKLAGRVNSALVAAGLASSQYLTGYVIATARAALNVNDTVLAALGKLEYRVNNTTTSDIVDGNVTLAKLAANSVNDSKIVNASITGSTKLVDLSVNTAKIANNAITAGKLAPGVALANIGSLGISNGYYANGSVSYNKLAADAQPIKFCGRIVSVTNPVVSSDYNPLGLTVTASYPSTGTVTISGIGSNQGARGAVAITNNTLNAQVTSCAISNFQSNSFTIQMRRITSGGTSENYSDGIQFIVW